MGKPRNPPGNVALRVLVVPPTFIASQEVVGGGERYALEYARALSRLTPTTLAFFDAEARAVADGPLEIRTFATGGNLRRLIFSLPAESLLGLGAYDVIHIMGFPTPLADRLLLLGTRRRIPVVLTDVGGGNPCWSTYLRRIHPHLDLNRLAAGLAPLSRYSATKFDMWRQPSTVLGGGIDPATESFPNCSSGYVLFVGRLLPHKGVLELIEALAPTTPLRIVGRPYDADYLSRLEVAAAGRNVRFILDADDTELARQYAGSVVVTQPSLPVGEDYDNSELLGLVTLEGMAAGRPVVVTRAGSLPELVVDGETGFVVRPGDGEELRERIERLLGDRALGERMGAAGRRRAVKEYSWDAAARRGLDLYRRVGRRRISSSR